MKTITIKDNETGEQFVITTNAYVLAHLVSGTDIKVQGQLSPDALGPFIKKYGASIFMNAFNKMT